MKNELSLPRWKLFTFFKEMAHARFFNDFFKLLDAQISRTVRCYSKRGPTDLKGRSVNAQNWLIRQMKDPYVKLSRKESYRCRSAFKLLEINEKHKLLNPGQLVIDCGAAPGSWSQVAVEMVNSLGTEINQPIGEVLSIDLQYIQPIEGATILSESDFTSSAVQQKILGILSGRKANVLLSDMAPAATGVKFLDHQLIVKLAMSVMHFSLVALAENGSLLVKLLHGGEISNFTQTVNKCFDDVRIVKPHASRMDSAEIYILAQGFSLGRNK